MEKQFKFMVDGKIDAIVIRPVEGYPMIYVSKYFGRVYKRICDDKFQLLPQYSTVGYDYVSIKDSAGVWRKPYVHQLVGLVWVDKPVVPDGVILEIDHIDSNRHNNNADNLQWLTRSENVRKACSKPVRCRVSEEDEWQEFESASAAAEFFVWNRSAISKACKGMGWGPDNHRYKGLCWELATV